MRRLVSGLCALAVMGAPLGLAHGAWADEGEAWAALQRGGMVIMMRHASAPGPEQGHEGDPPNFRLDDCTTQRNLDAVGRRQAGEIGAMLRSHNILISRIMSSPWCRARDTALLMNLDVAIEFTPLLRNVGEHTGGAGEVNALLPGIRQVVGGVHRIIREWSGPGNLLMVSHGRTVVALLYGDRRRSPEQARLFVLQPTPAGPGPFREVGSIPPPY
jgi:broad specificity phosphatase PhoE